ncbi:peroxidase skpo-1-like [Hydractinia symbiolongicarpus]|uniref:peroxidase skpo-1-like n=1 Tax=Hydractinia symbiolongicarpus TaxID=13093 RepID=UPI00254DECCA|nr:peroxidase skpo-1-like [Hydractinia symbiolongicarpus]
MIYYVIAFSLSPFKYSFEITRVHCDQFSEVNFYIVIIGYIHKKRILTYSSLTLIAGFLRQIFFQFQTLCTSNIGAHIQIKKKDTVNRKGSTQSDRLVRTVAQLISQKYKMRNSSELQKTLLIAGTKAVNRNSKHGITICFSNLITVYAECSQPKHNPLFKTLLYQATINIGDTLSNCIPEVSTPSCSTSQPEFRIVDGTCNNLLKRTQGAANTPLSRLQSADYVDNLDTPRGFPGTTPTVPTAIQVSNAIFTVQRRNRQRARGLSAMFMAFGQFLDHDIGYTTHPTCDVSAGCGSDTAFTYPCFPIRFQWSEMFIACKIIPIYSNNLAVHNQLRRLDGTGLPRVTSGDLMPIRLPASDPDCINPGGCSLVGDDRGDENIVLHTLHTVFVRNHNYIVKQLTKLRKQWSETLLFETARKINIAICQRIVYNEFLPSLVDLSPYVGYKPFVDASIINVFSTAALRFGHSLVPNAWAQLNSNFDKAFDDISLQASFENTVPIRQRGIESTAFGLLANQSQRVDTSFAFGLVRRLFVPLGENRRADLTALNIQRGRDHGIQTYGAWRRVCNLPAVNTFTDLGGVMPKRIADKFSEVYNNPNDIDIFAAGIAETRTNGKMLGPTFQCIQKIQFERFRDGDRFWYERPGVFTSNQRREINRMTLSKVLCNTLKDIVSIQPRAMRAVTSNTVRRECSGLRDIDFCAWLYVEIFIRDWIIMDKIMNSNRYIDENKLQEDTHVKKVKLISSLVISKFCLHYTSKCRFFNQNRLKFC